MIENNKKTLEDEIFSNECLAYLKKTTSRVIDENLFDINNIPKSIKLTGENSLFLVNKLKYFFILKTNAESI